MCGSTTADLHTYSDDILWLTNYMPLHSYHYHTPAMYTVEGEMFTVGDKQILPTTRESCNDMLRMVQCNAYLLYNMCSPPCPGS